MDTFETITYGENKVAEYAYAFKSQSGIFREFKDGISLLKWYYAYQTLKAEDFTLKGSSRMSFITDVFLSHLPVSSVVESILECELSNSQKASLIDFYYLSSKRVDNLQEFLKELSQHVKEPSQQKVEGHILKIVSPLSPKSSLYDLGAVGKMDVSAK